MVSKHGSVYLYDRNDILLRQWNIDGGVVSDALCVWILYLSHYPGLGCHPRERRLYNRQRKEFYWSKIPNDVYSSASDCQ